MYQIDIYMNFQFCLRVALHAKLLLPLSSIIVTIVLLVMEINACSTPAFHPHMPFWMYVPSLSVQ